MRSLLSSATLLLILAGPSLAAGATNQGFDWDQWRDLPVLDGGRAKPLDTLAWETLRTLSNRASIADPETGEKLGPVAWYLSMMFEWQGWGRSLPPDASPDMRLWKVYSLLHEPDKWDRAPLLRVDFLALREALGMAADAKHVAPADLLHAKIAVPPTGREVDFLPWAEELAERRDEGLSQFEDKALDLAVHFWTYQRHRMGVGLEVAPVPGAGDQVWIPLATIARGTLGEKVDPTGNLRQAGQQFLKAREHYLAGDAKQFNEASAGMLTALRAAGSQYGDYPEQSKMDLEVTYNLWTPFRYAWVFTLSALLLTLLAMGTGWKGLYRSGFAVFGLGLVAMAIGFAMRIAISGRAPVTNMYESVIFVGLGIAVLGAVLELIYRRKYILAAAAGVSTVALVLADNCPAVLDPSLNPLTPVLRSNFWLTIHVMTITSSYAAFALALGIANITLGYFLAGSRRRDTIAALSKFTYRALQVGVLLLAAGTILGGVWADYSWGRFWGWDPKEVWALIALLGYLAVLHARYVGWVGHFALAALSTICFSLVLMAWYGVNFVLGTGLHSYGFGGGGQFYVFGAVGLQLLYVGGAALRYRQSKDDRGGPQLGQPLEVDFTQLPEQRESPEYSEQLLR